MSKILFSTTKNLVALGFSALSFVSLTAWAQAAAPGDAVAVPSGGATLAPGSASHGAVAAAPQPPASLQWLLIGGMVFFMWFFIIRPQAKRQKEHRQFLESLAVGSEVVTSGGVIGKVTALAENVVTLDVGAGHMKVLKSAISAKWGAEAPGASALAAAPKA